VKVILSGDGGDDIFFGYTARTLPLLRKAASGSSAAPGEEYLARHRFVPEGWMQSLFPALASWPEECDLFRNDDASVDRLAQWMRWNEFTGHLTRVLLKVDRASMFHSLEVRVPLLDREVIDVACRVDWRSCVDLAGGIGKQPLRHALARHVCFQTITKQGFTVPMSAWLRGHLRPIFEDVVLSRPDILGLPLDRAALREQFAQHLAGRADHAWGLWRLLGLCLWENRHYRRGSGNGRGGAQG
jgi:asparagine synthase (glutamine-hydrolysing)